MAGRPLKLEDWIRLKLEDWTPLKLEDWIPLKLEDRTPLKLEDGPCLGWRLTRPPPAQGPGL